MTGRPRTLLWIILAVVFVAALVALTVFFRAELRAGVVEPLQAWYRSVQHNWLGLDADFRWAIFLILVGALIFLAFPALDLSMDRRPRMAVEEQTGRLAFWRNELKVLLGRGYLNRFTIFELRRLALEVVGFRQQMNEEEAEEWLKERLAAQDGQVPEVMRLLVDSAALVPVKPKPPTPQGFFETLRFIFGPEPAQPALAPVLKAADIEAVIRYLEKSLEVSDEDHHNP